MLGQMACSYFKENYEVETFDRKYDLKSRKKFIDALKRTDAEIIINCIGVIKQKKNALSSMIEANTFLVGEILQNIPEKKILIQPSTDCVFSGKTKKKKNFINDMPDAEDIYGITKIFSEKIASSYKNSCVVRSSIIGPDLRSEGLGFFNWLYQSERSEKIKGFDNHLWNGITTLEWCKLVEKYVVKNKNEFNNFLCFESPTVSKYQLIKMVDFILSKNFNVIKYRERDDLNMSLEGNILCKSLEEQLDDLKNYLPKFNNS